MFEWIFPRLVLLPFAVLGCVLAWSLRFLPRRDLAMRPVLKGIVTLGLALTTSGAVIAEVWLYGLLTGGHPLKDDNFFFVVMIAQGLTQMAIAFNSDAVLKLKEAEPRLKS